MPIKSTFFLMLISTAALAAEQASEHAIEHHETGIPTATIFWQAFNLFFVILIVIYATRKSLPEFYRQRQAGYVASAKKAEQAQFEAEKHLLDIKHKLEHLNTSYDESVARAHAEAADLRKQLIADAQEQARRVRTEAEITVKVEMQKAQRDLREHFVKDSISMARKVLSQDIASADHQKLQTEFTKNIEAVSP
jgi:F-type H+-transporting ATPase subunit b